jgi:ABC-type sugar transport system permease subunit
VSLPKVQVGPKRHARRKGMAISGRRQGRGGLALLVPYVVLLLVVGIIPAGYAVYQSFLSNTGPGFGGLSAYHSVVTEFQFLGTLKNIGLVMAVWLPFMIIE